MHITPGFVCLTLRGADYLIPDCEGYFLCAQTVCVAIKAMDEKYAPAFCGNLLPGFIGSPDYSTLIYSPR